MSTTVLGKVSITPKGAWSASTSYEPLDVVSYGGSAFLARRANSNVTPVEGDDWQMIAEKATIGNLLQTTGDSTEDAMSQKAATDSFARKKELTELHLFHYDRSIHNGYMLSNGTFEGQDDYHCIYTNIIQCSNGDVFKYKGVGKFSTYSWIAYLDGELVSEINGQIDSPNDYTDVVIPDGVNGVVFSSYAPIADDIIFDLQRSEPESIINRVETCESSLSKVSDCIVNERTIISFAKTGLKLINQSGVVADTVMTESFVSNAISVESDEMYLITGNAGWGCYIFAFYKSDGSFLSGYKSDGSSNCTCITDYKIVVPESAKTLVVSWNTTFGVGIVKKLGRNITGNRYYGKKWVCVGDSITEKNSATTVHYFDYISGVNGMTVVNMGVGGTGYMRGKENSNAFYQRVSQIPTDSDVITIFGSGNDLAQYSNIGEYTDATTDTICGCVNATLDAIFTRCPTTPVGIIAPSPWQSYPTTKTSENIMEGYVEKLEKIAKYRGVPFLDLYHCSNLRPEDSTNRISCFYNDASLDGNGDGVHPNELGHAIISTKIRAFLETLI